MAKNMIIMNRGDSYKVEAVIEDPTTKTGIYFLNDSDCVFLGVMYPHMSFENAFIKKKYTKKDQGEDGYICIELKPIDTLDLEPGVYYYSVKLVKNMLTENEEVETIVNKAKLVLND